MFRSVSNTAAQEAARTLSLNLVRGGLHAGMTKITGCLTAETAVLARAVLDRLAALTRTILPTHSNYWLLQCARRDQTWEVTRTADVLRSNHPLAPPQHVAHGLFFERTFDIITP